MTLISVVIPVFNGQNTIKKTIESVLNQTWKDYELIIINDGSTDSTEEVISNISDPRIKVFNYPNAGPSASRNRGTTIASGKYISFIDADDLWTPDKLEKQLQKLEENPQAKLAYSWTNYIDESDNFLYPGGHITANGNVYEKLLLNNFLENGSNPLIDRQALIEIGGFDESLFAAEDMDVWFKLAFKYEFVAVPSPQILYRLSTNSLSTNLARVEKQTLEVIDRSFSRAPESLQNLKPKSISNFYLYLTMKSLKGRVTRAKGIAAFRYYINSFKNNISLLQRKKK
ncbi:glycosyltransferase [Dapis sp. BLCC M229]|uniref:glycosyltransferase n=1 Tax=Dapis sp. BLCC M229 TaxID=3400188 RepID=UPI003CEA5ABB